MMYAMYSVGVTDFSPVLLSSMSEASTLANKLSDVARNRNSAATHEAL